MKKLLFLDIETRPTSNDEYIGILRQEAIDKRPSTNTRKEDKLFWDDPANVEKRFQESYRKTALDALWAEILCIGVSSDEGDPSVISAFGHQAEERALLGAFVDLLGAFDSSLMIVGHNLKKFDLPIIRNRLARNRIKPPAFFYDCRIYDTMYHTPCSNGLGLVSLNNACMALGLGKAKTSEWKGELVTGARVWDLYQAGEGQMLSEYCAHDVARTRDLFNALTFGGTVNLGRDESLSLLSEEIAVLAGADMEPARKGEILQLLLQNRGIMKKAS